MTPSEYASSIRAIAEGLPDHKQTRSIKYDET